MNWISDKAPAEPCDCMIAIRWPDGVITAYGERVRWDGECWRNQYQGTIDFDVIAWAKWPEVQGCLNGEQTFPKKWAGMIAK